MAVVVHTLHQLWLSQECHKAHMLPQQGAGGAGAVTLGGGSQCWEDAADGTYYCWVAVRHSWAGGSWEEGRTGQRRRTGDKIGSRGEVEMLAEFSTLSYPPTLAGQPNMGLFKSTLTQQWVRIQSN